MSFFKKITKITFLELLLITLIITIICIFIQKSSTKEGFIERGDNFVRHTDDDIFDEFYVAIYDNLVHNEAKNNYEVGRINNTNSSNSEQRILDIGCSTGHHVNLLSNNNNYVIGIDNSPEMIKKAKENFPDNNFKLGDALNSMEFNPDSFTHISCLYFTIYYIKNKKQFLENCYNWLMPGGSLILHLVDMHNFDPIIPITDPIITTPKKAINERITEGYANFDTLDYKSKFDLDSSINSNTISLDTPNAVFKETIKLKQPKKIRINEHHLYMCSQRSILGFARELGFILQSQEEMTGIDYENNFLYTIQKPS